MPLWTKELKRKLLSKEELDYDDRTYLLGILSFYCEIKKYAEQDKETSQIHGCCSS